MTELPTEEPAGLVAYSWPWATPTVPGPERGVTFSARGDLIKHRPREVGDLDVPSRFVAIFQKKSLIIEMSIIVDENGRPRCRKINFQDEESGVTTKILRTVVAVDTWVDWACARVIDTLSEPQYVRSRQEYAEREQALKGKRRQEINSELINNVATLYREAVGNGEAPIKVINAKYPAVGESTIRRWVAIARSDEYQLLPKAGKGRRAI